ncbi:hypothetical protein D3C81_1309910 [compost metagenome]
MAGFVGVLAGLVAGNQLQSAQRGLRRGPGDLLQGIQRQCSAWGLGGQEKHFVELLRHHGLEQREQRAESLADTGAGLGHQAAPGADRLVQGFGQLPLALAKLRVRKAQALQAAVTLGQALRLPLGPGQKTQALGFEKSLQLDGAVMLADQGLAVVVHVQVNQRYLDGRQLPRLAQQPGIDLGLGPVQLAMIGRLAGQVTTVGLDLFKTVCGGVITVGAAAHLQTLISAFECDLRLVPGGPPGHYPAMALDALLGSGRRCEAQVEVTGLGSELTQSAHRHAVAHSPSLQRTWQTATGKPCSAQNSSHRNWLS